MVDGQLWSFFVRSCDDGRDDRASPDRTVKSRRIRLSAVEGYVVVLLDWEKVLFDAWNLTHKVCLPNYLSPILAYEPNTITVIHRFHGTASPLKLTIVKFLVVLFVSLRRTFFREVSPFSFYLSGIAHTYPLHYGITSLDKYHIATRFQCFRIPFQRSAN